MNTENFNSHLKDYLLRLNTCFTEEVIEKIEILTDDLIKIWETGNNIFICGNGGSAANAIHIANDLHYGLGASINKDKKGMKVESLPANTAVITCLANDTGYENIFSHQLSVKACKEDMLIVLSGSGNSPNIVEALNESKRIGMKSYAILGFDGGKCKNLSDKFIHCSINDMLICEDIQMIIFNICFQWIVKKYRSKNI